ncbi:YfbM family protein [Bacillus sp. Xin]|uniref:YfbM family protein n=1 Tax=unclassified Bacillus (in: firmicutes) TaxID=185979 RepID=UPI0015735184|nr:MULTISPECIES: YfbM family protein [unclassified Bacillus (in: firmicutes)]MBC6974771.1 YfbM family protein [Bacillus sp. Xin]NSW37125.1 YfbM family protein [Bacillus sp. Xin1]
MGMVGQYILVTDEELNKIKNKELDIYFKESDLDIDKSWQLLHFILCGEIGGGEPPLGHVVPLNDSIINNDSLGTFYLTASEVEEAYLAIKDLREPDFKEMYNFQDLMDEQLYPLVEDDDPNEIFEYTYSYFLEIKGLYKQAVLNKQCVIFFIS